MARGLVGVLTASLLSGVVAPAASADPGPSVPLPGIPSVGVAQPSVAGRPADQASSSALSGDQPSGGGKEGGGSFAATPFSASASWDVSAQTGDFTWSYPMAVPPVPGGLAPEVGLSYRSSAVDGLTSATNNQASWVGDGWDLSVGFIERAYGGCADDSMGGTTPPKTGDLCWRTDNATASDGGPLVKVDGTAFKFKNDNGSRVERLVDAGNGDDNGEYWRVTSTDGTQYFYGSRAAANSTWTVPVFGDDAGEPCHGSTFDGSSCAQAWRWNLDKVVDTRGNVILYTYDAETNSYGRNLKDAAVSYVRGGTLRKAEYGLRDGQSTALGVVDFVTADRCVPGSDCTPSKKDNWPDVPWDEKCDTATCKDHYTPTFWSTKRLSKVVTRAWNGSAYADVDAWDLDQIFPDPKSGEKAALWLKGVTHTGLAGGSASLPQVRFEGAVLPNRVEAVDGVGPLNRYRLTGVVSEAGGTIDVVYAPPNCVSGSSMPASADTNTLRCYPATWAKKDFAERTDHFHKYVVASVRTSDRLVVGANQTSLNAAQLTRYEYLDGAAWHYDQSEFTKDKNRTWNEFRGFGRVRVRSGGADGDPSPVTMTEERFHRGMHGDKLPNNGTRTVAVTDSAGTTREDSDWLQGFTYETQTHAGETDTVIAKQISTPGWNGPTATRDHLKAYMVREAATDGYVAVPGGWRKTRVEYTHDEYNQVTRVNDLGDTAVNTDNTCTRAEYARNTTAWIISAPFHTETVSVDCATTPTFPDHALSDARVAYDGQAVGTAPAKGNVTLTESAYARPPTGPTYQTTGTATYDDYGRPLTVTDALGATITTAFTPTTGGPVTQVKVSNQLNHTATTTLDPLRGLQLKSVDQNNNATEATYDPLGRTTQVWLPNRPRASNGPSAKYAYDVRGDRPSSVTTSTINTDGNYTTTTAIYDGLYRERQRQAPTGNGRLLTDTRYDSQGRAFKTTQPYFNSGAVDTNLWVASDTEVPGITYAEFDNVGRQTAAVYKSGSTEKWRTTKAYEGDRVHVTPPAGGTATTTISDARGRTVELRHYTGPTPTGDFESTKYSYHPSGKLASATSNGGVVWRWAYDLRGNTIRTEDPDKGTSTSTYAPTGLLQSTTDARNTTLAYKYDGLGRKTEVRQGDLNGTLLQQFAYDTAIRGKGQLHTATRYVDGNAYTTKVTAYTSLGKPAQTSVVIPEIEGPLKGTYNTDLTYTWDAQLAGETHPAVPAAGLKSEPITHRFDTLGRLNETEAGPDDIVNLTEYTGYGELARLHLGSVTGKRAWQSYYYETDTRRLTRTITDTEVPAPMQSDVNYTYDPAGNITSITDKPQGQQADQQCFRYDHLRRLTTAWTPTTPCTTPPATDTLGGPAPYWHAYTFNAAGNRATETQRSTAGTTTRTYAYTSPHPHAPTAVTTNTTQGTTTDTYDYDATGNTTTRKTGTTDQTLHWDAEGKVVKITDPTKTTEFLYTPTGTRLLRRDPEATTLYLGNQEIRLNKNTTTPVVTRYYNHGGQTVAMRVAGKLTYLTPDHQSTTNTSIDTTSMTVQKRRQLPYGAPRGTDIPLLAGDKGFVGGTLDRSTGLTHIGARQYDPTRGTFTSVDPVIDPSDPNQWNAYAYANHTPITLSDPTGEIATCPDGSCRGNRGPNGKKMDDAEFKRLATSWGWMNGRFSRPKPVKPRWLTNFNLAMKTIIDNRRLHPFMRASAAIIDSTVDDGFYCSKGVVMSCLMTGANVAPGVGAFKGLAAGVKGLAKAANGLARASVPEAVRAVPQGFTSAQFARVGATVRTGVEHIGDDVAVHGSRAAGTARPDSDIDIAIRVSSERFDELMAQSFKSPNPGSSRERTMLRAQEVGKIQSGEAGLRPLRLRLEEELGIDVDISVIRIGGQFDNGPYIRM